MYRNERPKRTALYTSLFILICVGLTVFFIYRKGTYPPQPVSMQERTVRHTDLIRARLLENCQRVRCQKT